MVVMRALAARGDGSQTRANGLTAQVHRTGAALADSAAVFRSVKVQHIADHPKKRSVAGTSTVEDRPFTFSVKPILSTPTISRS